jgi:hypothetical protein
MIHGISRAFANIGVNVTHCIPSRHYDLLAVYRETYPLTLHLWICHRGQFVKVYLLILDLIDPNLAGKSQSNEFVIGRQSYTEHWSINRPYTSDRLSIAPSMDMEISILSQH